MSELRLRTLAAFAALGAGVVLAFGACRDVVAGDSVDAAAELCERLSACFPDAPSCDALATELSSAEVDARRLTLASFGNLQCLSGGCGETRSCLDLPAFCEVQGASCEDRFDCCDWSYGLATCSSDGECCKTDGASCSDDLECCAGQCLEVAEDIKTCGGVLCKKVNASCDSAAECCTGHCLDGICSLLDCFQRGEACETTDQCCREEVQLEDQVLVVVQLECSEGICSLPVQPTCSQANEPCDPLGQGCCEGQGSCQSFDGSVAVCSTCRPANVECAQDGECCSGHCVDGPTSGSSRVCAAEDCVNAGACNLPSDCCNGLCQLTSAGVGGCSPCLKGCHNPCDPGDPISDECGLADESALAEVLKADPTCECQWDGICASQYAERVGSCG